MIGLIVSLGIMGWFARTAKMEEKNSWGWATAGFFSYHVPAYIWVYILGLIFPLFDIKINSGAGAITIALAISLSSIPVGIISAILVRSEFLLKNEGSSEKWKQQNRSW